RRRHTRCLSDWSSNVCSSDLSTQRSRQRRFQSNCSGQKTHGASSNIRSRGRAYVGTKRVQSAEPLSVEPLSIVLMLQIPPAPWQIGRASCRERVYISVV